jgi:hypothetical protein
MAVGTGLVGNLLQIRKIGREVPLVRVPGVEAVASEKYFAAGLAVEKFEDARSASACRCWYVMKGAYRASCNPGRRSSASRIRANP